MHVVVRKLTEDGKVSVVRAMLFVMEEMMCCI